MAYKNSEDRKAYHRQWYAQNQVKRVEQIRNYQEREFEKFQAYKASLSCIVCGYNRCSRALEFHHLESQTKESNIHKLIKDSASFAKVQREIAKCVVLCANCHRELHAGIIELPV